MSVYVPSRAYQRDLDIRFPGDHVPDWAQPLVHGWPPNGTAWLVVMGRRAGKSWLASAVASARATETTRRVDLRASESTVRRAGLACLRGAKTAPRIIGGVLLIDEPALGQYGIEPDWLAEGLTRVRAAGAIPVVLATPAEYAQLLPCLSADAPKDVITPPVLSEAEIARMTARAPDWAPAVAAAAADADAAWLQTPFLLELVLSAAEVKPELRAQIATVLQIALHEADARHEYRRQLFDNGLAPGQRAELRAQRWRAAGIVAPSIPHETGAGLLAKTFIPRDPVITAHLPEVLRIHHLSDPHHGGKLRATVDAKDHGGAAGKLAKLAGAGTPLDSYRGHVRKLAEGGQAPHLIIVTGDLVDRPGAEAGEAALAWLSALADCLPAHPDIGPDEPRVVLVGGNHDVSWDLCLDPRQEARHEWFAETFAEYPHPDLQLTDRRDRRLFIEYPGAGLRIALLGSAESGGEPVADRDRGLLEDSRDQFSNAEGEKVREIIYEIERIDPGIIAREILNRLTPDDDYLTLAALHHPVSPVPSVEVAPYAGILNAGQVKRALIAAGTALVLHGHTHMSFFAAERLVSPAPEWTLRIAGASTLGSNATAEQNGYNEILIGREGTSHCVLVRPVQLDGGEWLPKPGMAFRPGAPAEMPLTSLTLDPI